MNLNIQDARRTDVPRPAATEQSAAAGGDRATVTAERPGIDGMRRRVRNFVTHRDVPGMPERPAWLRQLPTGLRELVEKFFNRRAIQEAKAHPPTPRPWDGAHELDLGSRRTPASAPITMREAH
jgi:hypothetical protein